MSDILGLILVMGAAFVAPFIIRSLTKAAFHITIDSLPR